MHKYSQLLTKISELILKILIHVKTDINSVIIKLTILLTITAIDCKGFNFNTKTDNKKTVG